MTKFFKIIFVLITTHSFSQNIINTIDIKFPKQSEIFKIYDSKSNAVSFFLYNKSETLLFKTDEEFNATQKIISTVPSNDFNNLMGYSINNQKYYLYWTDKNQNTIKTDIYDFETSKATDFNSIDFRLSKSEKIIKTLTVNNLFYILSVEKDRDYLNVYTFTDGVMIKKNIGLSLLNLLDKQNNSSNLYDIMDFSKQSTESFDLEVYSNDSPVSLVNGACLRKLYIADNKLIFLLNNSVDFLQTITIDLSTFTATYKKYPQPSIENDDVFSKSNAYLCNDKLILFRANSQKLALNIVNFNGEIQKQYQAEKGKEIDFKNSPIFQEIENPGQITTIEKTSQFLNKVYNLEPSLSVFENNDEFCITIGAFSKVNYISSNTDTYGNYGSATMYGAMVGGLVGALVGAIIDSSNKKAIETSNSYYGRKVLYLNCLFDKNFEHIKNRELTKTAFDKLRIFSQQNKNYPNQTIFKLNNKLYSGIYSAEQERYFIYKFAN